MNKSRVVHTMILPPAWQKTTSCSLLLALLFVVPSAAEQPDIESGLAVPDNVAPHSAPTQPLPFSHKQHMTLGLQCLACHTNPDPGALMTFPATGKCVSCHIADATDTPAIVSLHAYSESQDAIPWVRVYAVTKGVDWSHRAHLDSGVQCKTCHGDIRQAEAVSETKAIVAMAACISCHEARAADTACVTCHAWPTDQLLGLE